ncbi:MAG: SCO family protein [Proteobacteria bacterium]|nr:SCO family protein [Pseudomonadota bacterium]
MASDLPNDSLYQLRVQLVSQTGSKVGLNLDQGYPTLLSMFYGSCTAACPMLITSIQVYESHLDPASQARLRVLLVSFDPSADTPEQLAKLAQLHRADPVRWTFASASETDARKIAALLGFSYRRLPDGTFDHSLLIKLLDREGRVVGATTTLVGDTEFQAKLQKATSANAP